MEKLIFIVFILGFSELHSYVSDTPEYIADFKILHDSLDFPIASLTRMFRQRAPVMAYEYKKYFKDSIPPEIILVGKLSIDSGGLVQNNEIIKSSYLMGKFKEIYLIKMKKWKFPDKSHWNLNIYYSVTFSKNTRKKPK